MNNEVIRMLVAVQDDLARAVIGVNVEQKRDDETIAGLQRELMKEAERADNLQRMLIQCSAERASFLDELFSSNSALQRCQSELAGKKEELANMKARLPEVKEQRRPSAKRSLFGDGGHDIVITLHDLETPKKK